jgi:uncharacterized membrane protein YbaN (DUF454 family)
MKFKLPEKFFKSRWRFVLGSFVFLLGIVTIFLPVGPGMFLMILGLYMINREWTRKKIIKIRKGWRKWQKKRKQLRHSRKKKRK